MLYFKTKIYGFMTFYTDFITFLEKKKTTF